MKKTLLLLSMIVLASCSNDDQGTTTPQSKNGSKDQIDLSTAIDLAQQESNSTARVSYKGYYWANGQTIKIKFLNGDQNIQNIIKQYASEWTNYANINFQWVSSNVDSDIKIGINWNGGNTYFTDIGKAAGNRAQNVPSMNIISSGGNVSKGTILQQFGIALGLAYEHLNPTSPIQWNKEVVYAAYAQYGWTRAQVDQNFLNKLSASQVDYTNFDAKSVMLPFFPSNFTLNGYSQAQNSQLSIGDKEGIKTLYPSRSKFIYTSLVNDLKYLWSGDKLMSPNGKYLLLMQEDGNLVIYNLVSNSNEKTAIWSTRTNGQTSASLSVKAFMTEDGNFVLSQYNKTNYTTKTIWSTQTNGNPEAYLTMQDDGNLVVYNKTGRALWASNTVNK